MEKRQKKDASRYEERQRILSSLSGTRTGSFLKKLGRSPLRLTNRNVEKVIDSLPIPREQQVLWADCEFDLRPSGVACTEYGVFIKTDEAVFHKNKGGTGRSRKATLYYYQWSVFDPAWFVSKDKKLNKALFIDKKCQYAFVSACKRQAKEDKDSFLVLDEIEIPVVEEQRDTSMYALAPAAVESSERAVFVEQKSLANNPAGHGEMAEEANTLLDRLHGMDARVVGRDNAKDGADRLVDGVRIQTKYYKTATGSVEACFQPQNGTYRYMNNGKPMQLEVPKDQWEKAVKLFEHKIKQGKVPGVTDPSEAKNIVRKGRLTYRQSVNLTKPGTIESLAYDAATGAVICTSALGITFVTTVYLVWRRTGDIKQAIQAGTSAGIEVFGISFAQHLLVSQVARTNLAQSLLVPSQVVVEALGPKASATLVNGIRVLSGKSPIYGAAASKHLAKILRSNAMTSAIAFAVFSVPDTYKLVQNRTSSAQYVKNIATLAGGIAAGAGGAVAAGVAAGKVAGLIGTSVAPGVGTAIGIAGGFVGGVVGSAVTSSVGDVFYEGDVVRLSRLFNAYLSCLANEYLLDDKEVDILVKSIDEVSNKEFKSFFEKLQRNKNQEKSIRRFLEPKFDSVINKREQFLLPTSEEVIEAISAVVD